MKGIIRRIAILLVIVLLAPTFLAFIPSLDGLTAEEVSAKTAKAELGYKEATVGISSSPEYIYINAQNYDATYSFTSANPKIATVSEYGMISGVAKGKTTITVKETYKKKVTEVGKITVNVVGAKLEVKSVDVGVNNGAYAWVSYANFNAVYTFKSSDTKIAKVDEYGYISGLKLGKATITVSEKLKGKTVKIGDIAVNVLNGKLAGKEMEVPVSSYASSEVDIACMNPKAVYSYKSADAKIVSVSKDGFVTGHKKGTTTISVSETFSKKTVKLGSITVKVVGASINKESNAIEIGINSSNTLTQIVIINNANWDAVYTCESKDDSIASAGYDENGWYYVVKGVALGTTTLTVYEEFNGEKSKVGTVKVTVKEIPITGFTFDTYWMDEVKGVPTKTYNMDEYWGDYLSYFIYKEPYNATTPVTYTTSDEAVVTVNPDGYINLIGEGTATITITCGEFSAKFDVIVNAGAADSEEALDDSEYDDGEDDFN